MSFLRNNALLLLKFYLFVCLFLYMDVFTCMYVCVPLVCLMPNFSSRNVYGKCHLFKCFNLWCHLSPLQSVLPGTASLRGSFSPLHSDCHSNFIYDIHLSSSIWTAFCLLKVKITGWAIVVIVRVLSTQSSESGRFPSTDFAENPPTQCRCPLWFHFQEPLHT